MLPRLTGYFFVCVTQDNNITSMVIPGSVTTIGAKAFYNNPITSLTIGNAFMNQPFNKNTIGAFSMSSTITELVILYGFTTIGDSAFSAS